MSTFDSPVARCEVVREMVLTDQTQLDCAHEHDCPADSGCPLCAYFAAAGESAEEPPPDPERAA